MISLIAHELQRHEIAQEPGVHDEASMRKLCQRIGVGRSVANRFDTEAARTSPATSQT